MKIIYLTLNAASVNNDAGVAKGYPNSISGRADLALECPLDIVQQIFEVWGDTPTVDEPVLERPEPVIATPSTQDVINANIMARLAELEGVANG